MRCFVEGFGWFWYAFPMKKLTAEYSKPRTIYFLEFPDKSAYVGLTWRKASIRLIGHKSDPNRLVRENFSLFGDNFILKNDGIYHSEKDAQFLENFYVEKYRKEGWRILNIKKPGGLGGNKIFWTKELCALEAKKYKTRRQFHDGNISAYRATCDRGWSDEICGHMEWDKLPSGTWTKENCQKEALKYSSKLLFHDGSRGAYEAASRHNWLEEISHHMKDPRIFIDYDYCKKIALKYKFRVDFSRQNTAAYHLSRKNNWLDEICKHMERKRFIWTKEKCHEEAKKYKHKNDLRKGNSSVYTKAHKKGWISEICAHMVRKPMPERKG